MHKELIVSSSRFETKLAILEDDRVRALFIERSKSKGILGNIYKGRVTKVLPGMQAAFVDIGMERHGFLYVGDVLEEQEDSEMFDADDSPEPARRQRDSGGSPKAADKARKEPRPATVSQLEAELSEFPVGPVTLQKGRVLPQRIEVESAASPSRARKTPPVGKGLLPDLLDEVGPRRKARHERRDEAEIDETSSELYFFARNTRGKSSRSNRSEKSGNGRDSNSAKIADLLKEGQEVLVQVAKEPIGRKGARLTAHIALPGRYLVFMPSVERIGVSRQIESERERHRLKEIVQRNRESNSRGFIVRTAGENQPEKDIVRDIEYLTRIWSQIGRRAGSVSAPALVHAEPGLVERTIRDRLSDEFKAIRVDDEDMYQRVVDFVSAFNPDFVERIRLYTKSKPILDEFNVSTEIDHALQSKVWLRNGSYIVINQTEALVAIDVNTGKFVGRTNSLEETITKANIEAVEEIVRQLQLRDLGGIIIIDFIDMEDARNRRKVLEALQRELGKDRVPSKILRFNEFGLVAITRKRDRKSLEKTLCQPCLYCEGKGMTRSLQTLAYSIHDHVRRNASSFGDGPELMIRCHPHLADALRDEEKEVIQEIEAMTRKRVTIRTDPLLHVERFSIIEA